jgi:transcriptional regulator with XRE-family HTH domain
MAIMDFVAFLQGLMRRRGRLPSQLAADLGVSHTSVSRWLSGKDRPSLVSCVRLAKYAEVPLERVLRAAGHSMPIEKTTNELPEFREYAKAKYPRELDDDLVTLIEDLIDRRRKRDGKPPT